MSCIDNRIADLFEWQKALDEWDGSKYFTPPKQFMNKGRLFKVIGAEIRDEFKNGDVVTLDDEDYRIPGVRSITTDFRGDVYWDELEPYYEN